MTGWDHGLVLELPRHQSWDFGGHPYGLEPLALPIDARGAPAGGPEDVTALLRAASTAAPPSAGSARLPAPEPVEQLFWFRWITGHQVTFILWQLLARAATRVPAEPDARIAAARRVAGLVRGYSAMLLYTASCPREIYHRVIRPSMALQHPAFSGAWARDHAPVRQLLRGRVPAQWGQQAGVIAAECALNVHIHQGIAEKLVPGSPSLLQVSLGHGHIVSRRGVLAVLFDTYFLTLRAPLSVPKVLVQLVRRVHAIQHDLAANGLYPAFAPSRHEKPWELQSSDVDDCESGVAEILSSLAGEAIRGSVL